MAEGDGLADQTRCVLDHTVRDRSREPCFSAADKETVSRRECSVLPPGQGAATTVSETDSEDYVTGTYTVFSGRLQL